MFEVILIVVICILCVALYETRNDLRIFKAEQIEVNAQTIEFTKGANELAATNIERFSLMDSRIGLLEGCDQTAPTEATEASFERIVVSVPEIPPETDFSIYSDDKDERIEQLEDSVKFWEKACGHQQELRASAENYAASLEKALSRFGVNV